MTGMALGLSQLVPAGQCSIGSPYLLLLTTDFIIPLPSSGLLTVWRHLIQPLHSSSSSILSLPYLDLSNTSTLSTQPLLLASLSYFTLFLIFNFGFFQTPHVQSCFAFLCHVLSLHLHLTHPFNPCVPIKYHREAKPQCRPQGSFREINCETSVHSRDVRSGHLDLIGS